MSAYRPGDPAPRPLARRSEHETTANWTGDRPLVSILCPTYQHVDFIEDALLGFIGQDTSFPFEVLVRDDGSTDGTAAIVAGFAEAYPRIVRAFLEVRNTWGEISPTHALLPHARGSYFAICEGDDYWTDASGLARLVSALESSRWAMAAHHDHVAVRDGIIERPVDEGSRSDQSRSALMSGGTFSLRSTMFRRTELFSSEDFIRYSKRVWALDRFLASAVGTVGGSVYVREIGPAVYRLHGGGASAELRRAREERSLQKAGDRYWTAVFLTSRGEDGAARVHLKGSLDRLAKQFIEPRSDPRLELGLHLLRGWLDSLLRRIRGKIRVILRG